VVFVGVDWHQTAQFISLWFFSVASQKNAVNLLFLGHTSMCGFPLFFFAIEYKSTHNAVGIF